MERSGYRRLGLVLAMLPGLAACADMGDFGQPGPVQGQFSRTLDVEYRNLADYEQQSLSDPKTADYFRGKANIAKAGGMPPPDDPGTMDLPKETQERLSNLHDQLMKSLEGGSWIDNGAIAAMAQTRFDCWLAAQAVFGKADAGEGCRDKFEEAMDLLAPPAPQNAVYTIYFDSDSIGLSDDAMQSVQDAARSVRAQNDWVVVLSGYTDPSEKGETSRNLAIRRSMSVRNALAQQGVAIGDVMVANFGRAPEGLTGDKNKERRVDMQVMPRDQAAQMKSKRVQDLLPENFGSVEPLF